MKTSALFQPTAFSALLIAILVALAAPSRARADDRRLILSVDMTAEGKELTPPAPGHPVYYLPVNNGYQEVGGILKFYERKPTSENEIVHTLTGALAKQGYLPATDRFPPSIVLIFRWGTIAPQKIKKMVSNVDVIHAYIVGDALTDVNQYTSDGKEILGLTARHFLIVTALDLNAFEQHREVVLWRAHASATIWGSYLDDVIGTLIATAAPRLGKETKPGIISTPIVPLGRVIVGEPEVADTPNAPEKTK